MFCHCSTLYVACIVFVFLSFLFFFFNDTATTEIYTLSLHDALPISRAGARGSGGAARPRPRQAVQHRVHGDRSEEHTSELQSPDHLVCRLLLEKKKRSSPASLSRKLASDSARTPPAPSATYSPLTHI